MNCKFCMKSYDDKVEFCPNCNEPNPNLTISFKTGEWSKTIVSVENYLKSLEEVSKGKRK